MKIRIVTGPHGCIRYTLIEWIDLYDLFFLFFFQDFYLNNTRVGESRGIRGIPESTHYFA